MRNIFVAVFAAATLLVTGLVAQHEGHDSGQTAVPVEKSPAMPMMAAHAEAAQLTDRLVKDFAGIENEKDAKALKAKLAEHGKLLKELQTKLQGQSQMMEHMHGMMMGGSMMSGTVPAGEPKK